MTKIGSSRNTTFIYVKQHIVRASALFAQAYYLGANIIYKLTFINIIVIIVIIVNFTCEIKEIEVKVGTHDRQTKVSKPFVVAIVVVDISFWRI
jgi:hypothetical protein